MGFLHILIFALIGVVAIVAFRAHSSRKRLAKIARELLMSSIDQGVPCVELAVSSGFPRQVMGRACVMAEMRWRVEAEHVDGLVRSGLSFDAAMAVAADTRPKESARFTRFDRGTVRDAARLLGRLRMSGHPDQSN